MSKKKPLSHIFRTTQLASSAINGIPVQALCGAEKTFSREDFPQSRHAVCGDCYGRMAERVTAGHDELLSGQPTWVQILESAYTSVSSALEAPSPHVYRWSFKPGKEWRS